MTVEGMTNVATAQTVAQRKCFKLPVADCQQAMYDVQIAAQTNLELLVDHHLAARTPRPEPVLQSHS